MCRFGLQSPLSYTKLTDMHGSFDRDEPAPDAFGALPEYTNVPPTGFGGLTVPQFLPNDDDRRPEGSAHDVPNDPAISLPNMQPESAHSDPWKMKQIHYIGSMVCEGEHPDPAAREALDRHRRAIAKELGEIDEALEAAETHNDDYASELSHVRQVLTRDFGERVGAAPMYILGEDDFSKIDGSKIRGLDKAGRIIVCEYTNRRMLFGKRPVVSTLLHEGAHERAGDRRMLSTSYTEPGIHLPWRGVIKYDTRHAAVNELTHLEVDPKHGFVKRGAYFEEGFVESYAIRATNEILGSIAVICPPFTFTLASDGKNLVGFSDGVTASPPHYDKGNDCLYVPWRYAYAVGADEDRNIFINPQDTPIAAYGIDLLDTQLPGLYSEMARSHTDPALREYIKERVDGIEKGLHKRLASLPYSYTGLREGTKIIVERLGIADQPVPPDDEL